MVFFCDHVSDFFLSYKLVVFFSSRLCLRQFSSKTCKTTSKKNYSLKHNVCMLGQASSVSLSKAVLMFYLRFCGSHCILEIFVDYFLGVRLKIFLSEMNRNRGCILVKTLLITIQKKKKLWHMWAIWCDVSWKEGASCRCRIYYLDLLLWNFTLSWFNAELDDVIFIDMGLDTNHLWVNWN